MSQVFEQYHVDFSTQDHPQQIVGRLVRDGIVILDGIGAVEEFSALTSRLGPIRQHRDSDEHGVTRIVVREELASLPGYGGFTRSGLPVHTDASSAAEPPTLVTLFCGRQAESGGESLFVDGKAVYEALRREQPDILGQLLAPTSVVFGGPPSPYFGSIFTQWPTGHISVRFRYDQLGYFAAPLIPCLPTLLEILQEHTVSFRLDERQGYIIQNSRWLHGRTAFAGEREVYRILVDVDPTSPLDESIKWGFLPEPVGVTFLV